MKTFHCVLVMAISEDCLLVNALSLKGETATSAVKTFESKYGKPRVTIFSVHDSLSEAQAFLCSLSKAHNLAPQAYGLFARKGEALYSTLLQTA